MTNTHFCAFEHPTEHSNNHSIFVTYFNDAFIETTHEQERFINSLMSLMKERSVNRILDCAAGTGFPALMLRQRGLAIDCSDNDSEMIAHFKKNAQRLQVSDKIYRLNWNELGALGNKYDFVLCSGNSLAYNDTWGKEGVASSLPKIENALNSLKNICNAVTHGGYLYIDVPKNQELKKVTYKVQGKTGKIDLTEEVQLCRGGRHWKVEFAGDVEAHTFHRWSHDISVVKLQSELRRHGFGNLEILADGGQRPVFSVVVAQKN